MDGKEVPKVFIVGPIIIINKVDGHRELKMQTKNPFMI
jgi:hypothetical protein